MIVLDTHIWIWWVHGDARLSRALASAIKTEEPNGLGVSAISCWEVAKLVELGRLVLPCPTRTWLDVALGYPGVRLLDLSIPIIVDATSLPGSFHRDPADQLIVATARVHGLRLATADHKILDYPHVQSMH